MAELKRIKVTHTKSGPIIEGLSGFTGGSCLKEAEQFIKATGGKVETQELKPEFYETETEKISVGG